MQLTGQPNVSGFALALRAAREAKGISQRALARRCGLTAAYISLLESGRRAPERPAVERIAAALDLDAPAADTLVVAAGYVGANRGGDPLPGPLASLESILADAALTSEQRDTITALLLAYGQGLTARARAGKPLVVDLAAPWQTRILEALQEHMDADFESFRDSYLSRSFDL